MHSDGFENMSAAFYGSFHKEKHQKVSLAKYVWLFKSLPLAFWTDYH